MFDSGCVLVSQFRGCLTASNSESRTGNPTHPPPPSVPEGIDCWNEWGFSPLRPYGGVPSSGTPFLRPSPLRGRVNPNSMEESRA